MHMPSARKAQTHSFARQIHLGCLRRRRPDKVKLQRRLRFAAVHAQSFGTLPRTIRSAALTNTNVGTVTEQM